MVGVPGRSKACNTCKQRKVSCSLEKPECRTCIKSSRVCTGYQRERIFLLDHRTACDGQKIYMKPAPQNTTILTERKRKTRPKPKSSIEIAHPSNIPRQQEPPGSMAVSRIVNIVSLSSHGVYRQQILSDLLFSTLPKSYQLRGNTKNSQPSGWFGLLPSLPNMTPALETSILAIAVARFGRLTKDPALVHESLKFYTKGLVDLQKALWSPKLMHHDETAAACMSLVLYEVMECPGQSIVGWQSHIRACTKLFELKGADAYTSDFGHEIFLSFRLLEIQLALTERRSTYLADPIWIDRPWTGRTKSPIHQFLDVMAVLPNEMAKGFQLIVPIITSQCADLKMALFGITELLGRSFELDNELRTFYIKLEQTNLGPIYWPELSQETVTDIEDQEVGSAFPVSFYFADIQMAHLCMLYWASQCILWSGMAYSYGILQSFQVDISQYPPLEHRTDIAAVCRNICQSVEYCCQDDHKSLGTTIAVFPLKVAIESLNEAEGCERELEWANTAMRKIAGLVKIMDNLPGTMTEHAYLPG